MATHSANAEMIEVLKFALREGVVRVTFTKVDNTERVMRCTLSDKLIPKFLFKEEYMGKINPNDDVIKVFDLDKSAWRSFRANSIISTRMETE